MLQQFERRSPHAEQRLPGRVSYLNGRDRRGWIRGAPTFGRVVYPGAWPGVALAFHGSQGALEYDFDLAPGALAGEIALRCLGARMLRADGHGGAVIALAGGSLKLSAPRASQAGRPVQSRLLVAGNTVRWRWAPTITPVGW